MKSIKTLGSSVNSEDIHPCMDILGLWHDFHNANNSDSDSSSVRKVLIEAKISVDLHEVVGCAPVAHSLQQSELNGTMIYDLKWQVTDNEWDPDIVPSR